MKLVTELIVLFLRLCLGSVFLFAGIMKAKAVQELADSLMSFQILPLWSVSLMAQSLPFYEIIIGGLLVMGWYLRAAALASVITTAVFLLVLLYAYIGHLNINCDCFGSLVETSMTQSMARDIVLLVAAVLILLFQSAAPCARDSWAKKGLDE